LRLDGRVKPGHDIGSSSSQHAVMPYSEPRAPRS
jgi:hypothetical protein